MKRRIVFLDRDGVLNRAVVKDGKPYPPAGADEVYLYPLSEPLARLKKAGFALVVVSNQPDVARGTTTRAAVEAINNRIATELAAIDQFMVCYHDSGDDCDCRKPRPGMLLEGARKFDADLTRSFMVGDRWRDIEAGVAAGCRTIFVDRGYDERQPSSYDFCVAETAEALSIIERDMSDENG